VPSRRRPPAGPPGLTEADVEALRARVTAGDKPRVVVRSASAAVAAGTRGSVVRVGDPAESEYVVVRLGKDEVPFAPSELSLTGRAATATVGSAPARPRRPAPTAAPTAAPASTPRPAREPAAATSARPATRAAKRVPRRTVPPLVVTLRFRDGAWSVDAQRGARRLSKPSALRPGAVSAFAEHVDDEQVRAALVETVDSCRAVVEERAAALRAELADAEAALRDYR
jgi:arylamine N-acetyltransferase